jgi:endonuclease-3
MARGITPRQPAKSRRQEGARRPAAKISTEKGARKSASSATPAIGRKLAAPSKGQRYNPLASERVQEILKRLDQVYPDATCALHHRSAWELLVATILSAQCTDVRVNMVTPELFCKYPTIQDFAALEPEQLEPDIRSTGFFRNKSKSVVGAARRILSEFGGQVPEDMEKLLTIPGVARKTANVVLGSWFKRNDGVVVDTHVGRISRRLELTKETDPQRVERDLMKVIPQVRWTLFSHQIIWHGRKICVARSPKCVDCPLESICHAADKTWSTVEIHKSARP